MTYLQQINQIVVPLVRRDLLVGPQRKRMGAAPPEPKIQAVGLAFGLGQFFLQVPLGLGHGLTDARVDFEHALHQFGFEVVFFRHR